jgi:cation:H+ antiporter
VRCGGNSLIDTLLFLASIAIILLGAAVFTNSVEWLGKRLNVSEGVVGSIFAAVGTALPETMIPVIAILFGTDGSRHDVGIGAILGAPLMLSCLTIPLLGLGLLTFASFGKRSKGFHLNYDIVSTDLEFFLASYALALLIAVVPSSPTLRWGTALFLLFLYAIYLKRMFSREASGEAHVEPLYFSRGSSRPSYTMIGFQILTGLGCIIGGAHLFVEMVQHIADAFGIAPLILSTLITPIATELPEKFNSLIWISQKKDTLAVGNITGAMVFQGTFPVAVGLLGTPWHLNFYALSSIALAIAASTILYLAIRLRGGWRSHYLILGASFYLIYGLIIYFL